MLESNCLLIGPWQPAQESSDRETADFGRVQSASNQIRRISDRQTGEFLGVVRSRSTSGIFLWRWLAQPKWDVLESNDESLLLSVYAPWCFVRHWEIYDADERLVSKIHNGVLFDNAGKQVAKLKPSQHSPRMNFAGQDGLELGCLEPKADGVELMFTEFVEDDPFAKMALLGAVLVFAEGRRALDHKI